MGCHKTSEGKKKKEQIEADQYQRHDELTKKDPFTGGCSGCWERKKEQKRDSSQREKEKAKSNSQAPAGPDQKTLDSVRGGPRVGNKRVWWGKIHQRQNKKERRGMGVISEAA